MRKLNEKTLESKCTLCNESTGLKMSHIVPKFVFNYIKRTSVTGKFRDPTQFKKRLQDGPKYRLLCGECEQLFSQSEKYFSENIFSSYVNKENISIKYDDNLQYFIESVNWRFLITQINRYKGKKQQILKDIEISVRSKLRFQNQKEKVLVLLKLEYPKYPRWSTHSMFTIDDAILSVISNGFVNFKRMVTCDLFFYKNRVYIYSYFCGLIICSVYNCRIIDYLNLRRFIIKKRGKFKLKSVGLNNIITAHLLSIKYRTIWESLDKVPDEVREKYRKQVEKSEKSRKTFT